MSRRFVPFIFCAMLLALSFGLVGCSSEMEEPTTPTYKTSLAKDEQRNSAYGKEFPQQYELYLRNNQSSPEEARKTMTRFKGSIPFHKNDNYNELPVGYPGAGQPYLKNLWLGYPFSWEYNEARGHTYAIHDILEIDRINQYGEAAGLPATCWNCKTGMIPKWVEEYSDEKFWSMNFNLLRTKDKIDMVDHSIGCAACHDPQNMELKLYSIPLQDYLKRSGKDWSKMSRNDKRAWMCGQCHVEYYFGEADYGPNKKPVFPWDLGFNPDQIYEYYKDKGKKNADGSPTAFFDWVHPVSKTPMLKAQHPEYEFWQDGTHGAAGVTCADCHMPYMRLDGKQKVSSHLWTSPLRNEGMIDNSCRQCHTDKTADYLKKRVEWTQQKTYDQLLTAQELSVRAHEAIRRADEWSGYKGAEFDKAMAEARELTRKGQFFWDMVSAENSIGFHNPAKALDTLALSQQYSRQAADAAIRATNYEIAKDLEGNIQDIVPPLVEWTREMQMDPQIMEKHVWTRYLKPIPKSERYWRLQDKVGTAPVTTSSTN
ncbi:ammonia-forming cytochrome c nitrite reductase subunit c552 [Desulfovibrio sp. OttesenSCG-928-A18]|nr:ammonia-forming cytochrome c nitrite reductase subunit c552 [Desulfovibrio sp. OttesenSCG-928-A18]